MNCEYCGEPCLGECPEGRKKIRADSDAREAATARAQALANKWRRRCTVYWRKGKYLVRFSSEKAPLGASVTSGGAAPQKGGAGS